MAMTKREQETAARLAWLRYYVSTEEFDRSLPGSWSLHDDETWIPRPDAMRASARNAQIALDRARHWLHESGVPLAVSENARVAVSALRHSRAVEELRLLSETRRLNPEPAREETEG